LHFELPNFTASVGEGVLRTPPAFVRPSDRPVRPREDFEFYSIESGTPALHVLGQKDFDTGLRDVATQQQMGKEMSGLAMDRERGWLFITEKLNHRMLIVDVSKEIETFAPATVVLGQPDFQSNQPYRGQGEDWHPAGLMEPLSACYDHATKLLFVASGANDRTREILGFDLSGQIQNGMKPALRIGGLRSTVQTTLPYVSRTLALDEERRRLWSGLFALDLSEITDEKVPVIGWFGVGDHDDYDWLQGYNTRPVPNLLGYCVGFCHRFGGGVQATAVNPRTGTLYVADNPRYRVLCFQPDFHFNKERLTVTVGRPTTLLTGCGGLAPLQFSVVEGMLPERLVIDSHTGLIRGTPIGPTGDYRVVVSVQTALGSARGRLDFDVRSNAP
jgi:hypothetical protein